MVDRAAGSAELGQGIVRRLHRCVRRARIPADGNTGSARLGTTLDYLATHQGASGPVVTHFYAIANVYDNFKDAAAVNVAGTDFTTRNERWWGGLGVGGALDWGHGRYSVYGEVQAQTGLSHFGDSHEVNGTVGFRMRW